MRRESTRNNENEKPNGSKAVWTFPQVRALCDFGLITRRSRVQIPPPLRTETLAPQGFLAFWGSVAWRSKTLLKPF